MQCTPSNRPKGPLFCHKMGKKWVVCKRIKGVRFKKSTLGIQKVHIFGVPHPPKLILATDLAVMKLKPAHTLSLRGDRGGVGQG